MSDEDTQPPDYEVSEPNAAGALMDEVDSGQTNSRLWKMETRLGGVETHLGNVETRLNEVEKDIVGMKIDIATIKTELEHVATKEDIKAMQVLIKEVQVSFMKWGIGLIVVVVIAPFIRSLLGF